MRAFAILVAACALTPIAGMGQTLIDFTPASLSDSSWQLTGASPYSLTTVSGGWVLPAGAQLSRAIGADQIASPISVTLTATPLFSAQPTNGPFLELGSEDLVFLRTEAGGQLMVLSGTGTTSVLPGLVTLDANGFSAQPLTVQLGYDPASRTYSASALGGTVTVAAEAGSSGPSDVALSSGSTANLSVSNFTLSFAAPASPTSSATTSVTSAATQPPSSYTQDYSWLQGQIQLAVKQCLAGNFPAAWAALNASEKSGAYATAPSASDLGWRAATVVGFLKNQSEYGPAKKFAAFALSQTWSGAATTKARYWNAWIAFHGLGQRQQALTALGTASSTDPHRLSSLRATLEGALRSFPSN